MLLDVGVAALQFRPAADGHAAAALGAVGEFADRVPRAGLVAGLAEHLRAVGIGELDEVMVEDVAVVAAVHAAAHAVGLDRVGLLRVAVLAHHPVGDVDVVDVLLDDVVAVQPQETAPVANLEFHFLGIVLRARAEIAGAAARTVPVDAQELDVAELALVDLLDALDVAGLVVPLQADDDLQALLIGQLVRLDQLAVARRVGAAGLLHEDVLAGLDRRGVLQGPETGRRAHDDHVDAAVDGLLVGVQADEDPLVRDVDLGRPFPLEVIERLARAVLEGVGHGDQLHRLTENLRRIQAVVGRAGAASAAADQGDLEQVAAGGMRAASDAACTVATAPGGHGRTFQKITPGGWNLIHLCAPWWDSGIKGEQGRRPEPAPSAVSLNLRGADCNQWVPRRSYKTAELHDCPFPRTSR